MDVGVFVPHTGPRASPSFVRHVCTLAEEVGISALWAVDHLLMPVHTDSRYTLRRQPTTVQDGAISRQLSPNYELMTTLTWIAGFTSRIRLGTAVAVLTIRNAVLNARQVASLDVYSGGRVIYGVGAGWLREEAEAMNMPWDERGRRLDEHVELMRTLWDASGSSVAYDGEYHHVPAVDPEPRPNRHVPILVGGHSDAAIDRAARLGDGWIASRMSPERFSASRHRLTAACERHGRDPDEQYVVVNAGRRRHDERRAPSAEQLAHHLLEYGRLGADHVQIQLGSDSPAAAEDELRTIGDEVLPLLG